jgi:hypothetical protein
MHGDHDHAIDYVVSSLESPAKSCDAMKTIHILYLYVADQGLSPTGQCDELWNALDALRPVAPSKPPKDDFWCTSSYKNGWMARNI